MALKRIRTVCGGGAHDTPRSFIAVQLVLQPALPTVSRPSVQGSVHAAKIEPPSSTAPAGPQAPASPSPRVPGPSPRQPPRSPATDAARRSPPDQSLSRIRTRAEYEQGGADASPLAGHGTSLPARRVPRVSNALSRRSVSCLLTCSARGLAFVDSGPDRVAKRPRIASISEASTSTSLSAIDRSLFPSSEDSATDTYATMRLTDRDNDSTTSLTASPDYPPEAGPSTANGHATNGHAHGTNGASGAASTSRPNGKAVTQVALSGTTLYDDSFVDREEFVRLVIQSLRDVGYMYVVVSRVQLVLGREAKGLDPVNPQRHWKQSLGILWRHRKCRNSGSVYWTRHGSKQRPLWLA